MNKAALTATLGFLLLPAEAASAEPRPTLAAVHPSAAVLPSNQLKFYLHFPVPMPQGEALSRLALVDRDTGQPVPEPFRETELWDHEKRRLTLWLHPGRQKTGVNLNADFGPILTEGRRYELRLTQPWSAEDGTRISPGILKQFSAGPPQRAQLRLSDWSIAPLPAPGSREALIVRFPTPLDHALLRRCLSLWIPGAKEPVPGQVDLRDDERTWSFTPERPWSSQAHELRVLSFLEDLAGNSLARPFEVDLQAPLVPAIPEIVKHPLTRP